MLLRGNNRGKAERDPAVLTHTEQEYHKRCLTCLACKKTVGPGSFEEHEGDVRLLTIWPGLIINQGGVLKGGNVTSHSLIASTATADSSVRKVQHHIRTMINRLGLIHFHLCAMRTGYGHGGAMTGEYRDPILDRSPFSSPRASDKRTSFSLARRDGGGESPTSSSWSTDSPLLRNSFAARSEMARTDLDGNGSEGAEFHQEGENENESEAREAEAVPVPVASTSRPASPIKSPLSGSVSFGVRPESPASSIATSNSTSSRPRTDSSSGGARYNSNLGILGSSGPDLCRRCGSVRGR